MNYLEIFIRIYYNWLRFNRFINLFNIIIFSIVFLFIIFFIFIRFFPFLKINFFFLEWDFLSFKVNFFFNRVLFSFILILVTFSVLIFRTYYLDSEIDFNYYYFILLIFVGSIFFLNYRNNIFSILVSWDILGISRFFLVLFYNNWDRCRGSINTALTNRFGDFFLFLFFRLCIFSSYNFLRFSYFSFYILLLLILTSFTKSAQFPFRRWLPKAMRAPTPVSSLVHRRTLVTAGLILLINFNFLLKNLNFLFFIFLIGILTIFFSSITALLEEDLKKVVALRTLSQIGFSITTLGLGFLFISFFHLVSHALFKRCLFIQVGYIIHCSLGQQDGRNYINNGNLPNFIQIQILVTLFCLCGLIFSRGSVRKDLILELFYFNNFIFFCSILFFISIFLTFGYSYRLWKRLFVRFNRTINHFRSSIYINYLRFFLVFISVTFLWWLNFNILNIPSIFIFVDFFSPLIYCILLLLLLRLLFKLILFEFKYKFLVDFFSKYSIYFSFNYKFIDYFLNKNNSFGFSSLINLRFKFNNLFNLNVGNIIFIVLLALLLF